MSPNPKDSPVVPLDAAVGQLAHLDDDSAEVTEEWRPPVARPLLDPTPVPVQRREKPSEGLYGIAKRIFTRKT